MTTIPGASKFLTASTFANRTGGSAIGASLLSESTTSLLDVGRRISFGGGISGRARALNAQQISNSSGLYNGLFSASIGETSSLEALQTQVAALRSSKSDAQLSRAILLEELEIVEDALDDIRGLVADIEA